MSYAARFMMGTHWLLSCNFFGYTFFLKIKMFFSSGLIQNSELITSTNFTADRSRVFDQKKVVCM